MNKQTNTSMICICRKKKKIVDKNSLLLQHGSWCHRQLEWVADTSGSLWCGPLIHPISLQSKQINHHLILRLLHLVKNANNKLMRRWEKSDNESQHVTFHVCYKCVCLRTKKTHFLQYYECALKDNWKQNKCCSIVETIYLNAPVLLSKLILPLMVLTTDSGCSNISFCMKEL